MKRTFVPALALALTLAAAPAGAAAAQPSDPGTTVAPSNCAAGTGRGGAAALVAAVAAGIGSVCILNDSLNNLLQNADIHVLENILNNSPILNDLTITITDVSVANDNTVTLSLLTVNLLGVVVPLTITVP